MSDAPSERAKDETETYRAILRASSLVGAASVANIILGLIRNKMLAVLLGPAGVGIVGILSSLMATATAISSLGVGQAGIRQVAEARAAGNREAVSLAYSAIRGTALSLAVAAGMIFFFAGEYLSTLVLGSRVAFHQLPWLGLGVAASIAASAYTAILNGSRRIKDLAILGIITSLASTTIGTSLLYALGAEGVVPFLLVSPLTSLLAGWIFCRDRISSKSPIAGQFRQWLSLLRLGSTFMLAGTALTLALLLIGGIILRGLGPVSLGHFQASWTLSVTYLGFVLAALGTDFYPRLTEIIGDAERATDLINRQTEVALLLATPALVMMLSLSPWILSWLYSSDFKPAADLLRLQILSDVLKLLSWPLGYVVLAAGKGRYFLFAESFGMTILVLATYVLTPFLGIEAAGVGSILMYGILLPIVYWRARQQINFTWSDRVLRLAVVVCSLAAATAVVASFDDFAGLMFGTTAAILFSIYSLGRLSHVSHVSGWRGRLGQACRKVFGTSKREADL